MNSKDKILLEVDESFKKKLFLLLCGDENEKGILKTFEENEWCFRASEENVRSEIVDPIIKTIGWQIPYLRREDHNRDYILCAQKYAGKDSTRIVIEAKKYREQLKTNVKGDKDSQKSPEDQLKSYINGNDGAIYTEFGILTNGIRWCLYQKDKCLGEINIKEIKKNPESIYSFFKLISFELLKKYTLNDFHIETFGEIDSYESQPPNSIIIGDNVYQPRKSTHSHCYANYFVVNECIKHKIDLFGKEFFREIVFKTSSKDSLPKTWRTYKQSDLDTKVSMIGDYGMYDKLTLLQEINSTLNLGLNISVNYTEE